MIRGIVMNGPTPIISMTLREMPSRKPIPRSRPGSDLAPIFTTEARRQEERHHGQLVLAIFSVPRCLRAGSPVCSLSCAQEVYEQPYCTWNSGWQLTEERVSAVDVGAFPILGNGQSTLEWLLRGIVTCQHRMKVCIPVRHEVETALLHPSVEIVGGNFIWIIQHRTLRVKDVDRRLLYAHALSAVCHRVRSVMTRIE